MSKLVEQLKKHEGFSKHVYQCTAGCDTIGYGFNLDAGMSKRIAELILRDQVLVIHLKCIEEFIWFSSLSVARQGVVINMVYNLGMEGFKKFKKMTTAIAAGDNSAVVNEMLDSRWAHQVKGRAWELADQWRDDSFISP
jgi:lysozyme